MYMNQGEESAAESACEHARRRAGTAHAAGRVTTRPGYQPLNGFGQCAGEAQAGCTRAATTVSGLKRQSRSTLRNTQCAEEITLRASTKSANVACLPDGKRIKQCRSKALRRTAVMSEATRFALGQV